MVEITRVRRELRRPPSSSSSSSSFVGRGQNNGVVSPALGRRLFSQLLHPFHVCSLRRVCELVLLRLCV